LNIFSCKYKVLYFNKIIHCYLYCLQGPKSNPLLVKASDLRHRYSYLEACVLFTLEVCTGQNFRISPGPAQGAFGVTPKFIVKYVTCSPCKPSFIIFESKWSLVYLHFSFDAWIPLILECYAWRLFWNLTSSTKILDATCVRWYLKWLLGEGTYKNPRENEVGRSCFWIPVVSWT
jgi:hypothetical protein